MFIPNSQVRFLENVNITNSYVNTFSFSTLAAQTAFFQGKTKYTFQNVTYVRKNKTIMVEMNAESLWNVSYLMFQNTNFGSKWFYAFITDIVYVNDNVSEISFEIDVIQTWLFSFTYKNCYIEREHTPSDAIGEHTVDEGLNCGDAINRTTENATELQDLAIVISTTVDSVLNDVTGDIFTGVYSGTAYYATSSPTIINDLLTVLAANGKADAVTSIFMMPSILIPNFEDPIRVYAPIPVTLLKTVSKNYTDIDGYVPKNNKLFCYPYNFLAISNNKGATSNLHYEYCSETDMTFIITCNISPSPTVYIVPTYYKGSVPNYDEAIGLGDYPLCNWTMDVYKNWLAQNSVSNAVSIGTSVLGLGVGVATGNPIAIAGGALGVAGSIGNFYEQSLLPNPLRGSSSGGANVALGNQTFTIYRKTIRQEYAKMIDEYFTRYGYKVNSLKTPNVKSRENWNYIKCHESNIVGNLPNLHLKKINEIHERGLTFWHNDNVGNYNRTNNPI